MDQTTVTPAVAKTDTELALEKAMKDLTLVEAHSKVESELDKMIKSLDEKLEGVKDDKGKEGEKEGSDSDKKEDEDEDKKKEKGEGKDDNGKMNKAIELLGEANTQLKAEVATLSKSVNQLIELSIKQTQVIGNMEKSRKEEITTLKKSIDDFGKLPIAPGTTLGLGSAATELATGKSHTQVCDALLKSVQEGKIENRWLGIYATHKDVSKLPDCVRQEIGV